MTLLGLAQVLVQISRVGRLGRWLAVRHWSYDDPDHNHATDATSSRIEIDLGSLYVLVMLAARDILDPAYTWKWAVFEEIAGTAPGTPRFIMLEGGPAASMLEAKLVGLKAALARHARPQLQDYKHGIVGDLIALALVRLDAEMEGRPLP